MEPYDSDADSGDLNHLHSRKLAWKPKKGPYKDYSPSKRGLYGFAC